METWKVITATGEFEFGSLSDALAWIGQQTPAPMILHRVVSRHYGTFGVPGGKDWPPANKKAFTQTPKNVTKVAR